LPAHGEADLRYAGQSFELTVPLGEDLAGAFHRAHEARYGYADRLVPSSSSPSGRQRCARPRAALAAAEPLEARGPARIELEAPRAGSPGWWG